MFKIKFTEMPEDPTRVMRDFIGNPVKEFSEMFDRFTDKYAIKVLLADDELHRRKLKPKAERLCRFCKESYGKKEKFKKTAHLFPALIGNRNLFSDFECDKCNELFGKYENNLANFLGVARAMNIHNARSGKLKFKSPDKTFIVKKDDDAPASISKLRIESHEEENDHFTLDPENKKVTFHTLRHPYNPHKVYKSLLKIGLSILPDDYVVSSPKIRYIQKYKIFHF